MNTTQCLPDQSSAPADPISTSSTPEPVPTLDQILSDIRAGRRLGKLVISIDGFFTNQLARLNGAIEQCQQAADNDAVVQRMFADFKSEKRLWEEGRQAEIVRLQQASEKLSDGWNALEVERRNFLDNRNAL